MRVGLIGFVVALSACSPSQDADISFVGSLDFAEWWDGSEWEHGLQNSVAFSIAGQFTPEQIVVDEAAGECSLCGRWEFASPSAQGYEPARNPDGSLARNADGAVPVNSKATTVTLRYQYRITRDPDTLEYDIAPLDPASPVPATFASSIHGGSAGFQLELYSPDGKTYLLLKPYVETNTPEISTVVAGWGIGETWLQDRRPGTDTDANQSPVSPRSSPPPASPPARPDDAPDSGGCQAAASANSLWSAFMMSLGILLFRRRRSQTTMG